MSWRMLEKPLATADVSGQPTVSQAFRHPTKDLLVCGVKVALCLAGNPAFTNLVMKIYSDRAGSPGKLLATSTTSWLKREVLLDSANLSALKFAGFAFTPLPLQRNTWYHLVVVPTAYTGNAGSHLGWRISYPDPQYPMNLDLDAANAAHHHLEFTLFGKALETSE